MPDIDHDKTRELLSASFALAEQQLLAGTRPGADSDLAAAIVRLFASSTQAYREVLLGCTLARLQNPKIDIRRPYVGLGRNAFNGRDLDEKVINPFLHEKRVPCSRGPYLSVFRRSVRFDKATRGGLRDKEGYDAFLTALAMIGAMSDMRDVRGALNLLAYEFVELREGSIVQLSRLRRTSLEQCQTLINGLLGIPSGGRFPVLLVAAAFAAIQETYGLAWTTECQGINVSDRASQVGGDITVKDGDRIVLAAEVTERPVDRSRVVATFNTKIAPGGIEDYLFFVTRQDLPSDALQQARQYFSQGHEVNFVHITGWIVNILATLGSRGRQAFCRDLVNRLDRQDVPKPLKMAWNTEIDRITTAAEGGSSA